MWTRDAARLLQWDGIGSLAPGCHADLLDRDPIACRIDEIAETKVLRTIVAGATVYDSGAAL
jgi:predicted amidohydrolase YtcJ